MAIGYTTEPSPTTEMLSTSTLKTLEPVTSTTDSNMTSTEQVTSQPTSEPQTTSTSTSPKPTSPPAQKKHYVVKEGNITCLVMDALFIFTIPYLKKDGQVNIFH